MSKLTISNKLLIYRIIGIVIAVVLGVASYFGVRFILDYTKAIDDNKNVARYEGIKDQDGLQALKDINNDFTCWIDIKDLSISLPIVQASNTGNYQVSGSEEYYMNHNLEKQYYSFGTPFIRCGYTIDSSNFVVVGHSSYTGSDIELEQPFFTYLSNYLTPNSSYDYIITLDTFEGTRAYKVVSCFTYNPQTNTDVNGIISTTVISQNYLQNIKQLSQIDFHVELSTNDKFITLYTCYSEDISNRMIIIAKQIQ